MRNTYTLCETCGKAVLIIRYGVMHAGKTSSERNGYCHSAIPKPAFTDRVLDPVNVLRALADPERHVSRRLIDIAIERVDK